jgi:phage terminase large subunit-like protein
MTAATAPRLIDDLGVAIERKRAERRHISEGLDAFIPRVSRGYVAPLHLAPLIRELERAHNEPVRLVCHAPPRHGKTESVLHAIAWYLRQRPSLVAGYATYGADLSYSKSRSARALAREAGVELAPDAQGVKEWRTRQGGGLLATGVGGPFTGFGVNVLFVDDPFKNRVEAESSVSRQRVIDWWKDVAFTRLEPNGSAIVFATRWHPDDLSGHLIKQGWRYIRLPALADDGAPLWPTRYDAASLDEIRRTVGEYTWASLFQGLPRPRGGSVFNAEPKLYTAGALADALKRPGGWRKAIGLDFAYSKKTSADHSAAVLGLGFQAEDGRRLTYVLECLRRQVVQPVFAGEVAKMQAAHPGATAMGYVSSIEKHAGGGVEPFFRSLGARIEARIAAGDKFTRAQPYAAAWNDGRVLLPADVDPESWVNVFLAEHLSFTGSDDKEDDQVDSGAAMFDVLNAQRAEQASCPRPSLNSTDAPLGM